MSRKCYSIALRAVAVAVAQSKVASQTLYLFPSVAVYSYI